MGKYSETLMDHVLAPRNGGVMEHSDPTGHAGTLGRGPFLILFLKLDDDRITATKYHTYGAEIGVSSFSAFVARPHPLTDGNWRKMVSLQFHGFEGFR